MHANSRLASPLGISLASPRWINRLRERELRWVHNEYTCCKWCSIKRVLNARKFWSIYSHPIATAMQDAREKWQSLGSIAANQMMLNILLRSIGWWPFGRPRYLLLLLSDQAGFQHRCPAQKSGVRSERGERVPPLSLKRTGPEEPI